VHFDIDRIKALDVGVMDRTDVQKQPWGCEMFTVSLFFVRRSENRLVIVEGFRAPWMIRRFRSANQRWCRHGYGLWDWMPVWWRHGYVSVNCDGRGFRPSLGILETVIS
jgi:hypothetical protein